MRLTPVQIADIKSTTAALLGEGVRVTLFGSRVDDQKRGGDVDPYVEMTNPLLMQKIRCKNKLQELLDMPVDLVVKPIGDVSPISLIAKHEGILLRVSTRH